MDAKYEIPDSLLEATRFFADPDNCLAFMVKLRWPQGVTCPRCEAKEPSFLSTRRLWKCRACKKQFSAKVGTIFEDSPIPLEKWLPVLWLVVNCKNGISSYEMGRALKISQRSAWFMTHRIRLAVQTGSFDKIVGRGRGGRDLHWRQGPQHAQVPNVKRKTLTPEVREHVEEGSEVFTDSLKSYDDLGAEYSMA